jgi:hypothetical protein
MLRQQGPLTPEERDEVTNYTFTPKEVGAVNQMTPVLDIPELLFEGRVQGNVEGVAGLGLRRT